MQAATPRSFPQALEQVTEYWSPRIVGRVNDQYVKVAKVKGQLAWHKHEREDEMFLVVYGWLRLQFEDKEVQLGPAIFMWSLRTPCILRLLKKSVASSWSNPRRRYIPEM